MGTDFKQGCGGKGANQAVMAAKLGLAPVRFLGCVGDDAQGKMMREGMSSAGVDTEALATAEDDTPSGVAAILIGERSRAAASPTAMRPDGPPWQSARAAPCDSRPAQTPRGRTVSWWCRVPTPR